MPTLQWIGKDAVVRHHKDVPFRLLEPVPGLSHGEASGNLLVQGDNLDALKTLLPRYAGLVKCIYIDPPYFSRARPINSTFTGRTSCPKLSPAPQT